MPNRDDYFYVARLDTQIKRTVFLNYLVEKLNLQYTEYPQISKTDVAMMA